MIREVVLILTAMNPGKKTYMASLKPIDSPAVFTNTARFPACIIAIITHVQIAIMGVTRSNISTLS